MNGEVQQHDPLPTNSPEWYRAHGAVKRDFGRAVERNCEFNCGKGAREWAWLHGQDPWDTTNYIALCKPCHHAYDFSAEWHSNMVANNRKRKAVDKHKFPDEFIAAIQSAYATGRYSQRQIRAMFGISQYSAVKYTQGMAAKCRPNAYSRGKSA